MIVIRINVNVACEVCNLAGGGVVCPSDRYLDIGVGRISAERLLYCPDSIRGGSGCGERKCIGGHGAR